MVDVKVLCASLLVGICSACGPSGALAPLFEDRNGGGSGVQFQFQVPGNGDVVAATTPLAVTGSGLNRVDVVIDGQLVARLTEAPFEWILDPADFVLGPHSLELIGFHTNGKTDSVAVNVEIQRAVPLAEILDAMRNLPPGSWYEVPNTRLRAVGWDVDKSHGPLTWIMTAASGGAYDTKRDRLVVWGGGDDSARNEVYVYDVMAASWERLTDPSPFAPGEPLNESGADAHPDGAPFSRHTFDSIEYIPDPVDKLFVAGGGSVYHPGPALDLPGSFLFDFDTRTWERAADAPSFGSGSVAAVAPDGRFWMHGPGNDGKFQVYDPLTDAWNVEADFGGFFPLSTSAEIDPVHNVFVVTGSGVTRAWDLDDPAAGPTVLATTGHTEIEAQDGLGLVYHPPSGRLVAWAGGRSTYTLDLDTLEWVREEATNAVDPGPRTPRGTFGRFRYVASLDVFLVVNSVDTNVFVYRLP